MCAWCTTALTTLLVVFFKLLTEWLVFIIVPILCCSRQQQCLHGCHLAGREVIAGFKFLQDERICVLYVKPIQSASHVPQDLYILSAQAQAIYTLKTENRKMLYLKNCARMQPYQCQSVIHAFITFRHIHVKKTITHQAHSGFTEQLRALIQDFGGHREVCRTQCRKVWPAVAFVNIFAAVFRKKRKVKSVIILHISDAF